MKAKLLEHEVEEIYLTNSFMPKGDNSIKLADLISFRLFDYCLNVIARKELSILANDKNIIGIKKLDKNN